MIVKKYLIFTKHIDVNTFSTGGGIFKILNNIWCLMYSVLYLLEYIINYNL